jgi:hypothetical protein
MSGTERLILWELSEALRKSFSGYAKDIGPRRRWRYIDALIQITQAFDALKFPRTATADLKELTAALAELDTGIVRHFLKPEKVGANMSPGDVWIARSFLCMAADLLIESGRTQNAVFDWIGHNFAYLQPSLSRIPNSRFKRGTIRNWYLSLADPKQARRLKPTEGAVSLFADRWQLHATALEKCRNQNADSRADWLVSRIIDETINLAVRASTAEQIAYFKQSSSQPNWRPLPPSTGARTPAYSTLFGYTDA